MGCVIAMMAIATLSYLTLSGLTFGVLPVATLAITATAVVSGLIRKCWLSQKDPIENVKIGLKQNLLGRLDAIKDSNRCKLNLNQEITLKSSCFFSSTLSLKTYVEKMLSEDAKKAGEILEALENDNYQDLENALKRHRHYKLTGGVGRTSGYQLLQELKKPSNSTGEITTPRPST
jgi:hypothetical protein